MNFISYDTHFFMILLYTSLLLGFASLHKPFRAVVFAILTGFAVCDA